MAEYSNQELLNTLFSKVLQCVREDAQQKLPAQGKFLKFGIGFRFPDELYSGYLMIDFAENGETRVARIAVFPTDSDRAVNNFLFFDNTQKIREWLAAESSVEELRDIALHLRKRAEQMD